MQQLAQVGSMPKINSWPCGILRTPVRRHRKVLPRPSHPEFQLQSFHPGPACLAMAMESQNVPHVNVPGRWVKQGTHDSGPADNDFPSTKKSNSDDPGDSHSGTISPLIPITIIMLPSHKRGPKEPSLSCIRTLAIQERWHDDVLQGVERWKASLIQPEIIQRPFKAHFRLRRQNDTLWNAFAPGRKQVNIMERKNMILGWQITEYGQNKKWLSPTPSPKTENLYPRGKN